MLVKKRMIKYLPLLICTSVWAGPYVEAGVGFNGINEANDWDDCNDLGANIGLGYMWHLDNWTMDLGYQHYSQWMCGPPFSDYEDGKVESNFDAVNLTVRYEW